jgi:aspartyl-tRNA synthetase
MNLYGSDKPDLRFDLAFKDFTAFVPHSDFGAFKGVVEKGGIVKALVVPEAADKASRKTIGTWEQVAKDHGAFGLAWMKVGEDGLEGGISKFFKDQEAKILEDLEAKKGDIILFMASDWKTAVNALGAVRNHLGHELGLVIPVNSISHGSSTFPSSNTMKRIRSGNPPTTCSPCLRAST